MSLSVEFILKLIDQMTGPARASREELEKLQKTADDTAKKTDAAGSAKPFEGQAQAINKSTAALEKLDKAAATAGATAEETQKKLAAIGDSVVRLNQAREGFEKISSIGEKLGKPISEASEKAVEFEKRMESIARGGGKLDMRKKIGDDILAASKISNVPWQDLAKGEAHLVSLGGGEFLDKIAPVRERMAKLIYASGSEAESIYSLLERYMKLCQLSPEQAMSALEVNYAQGKKGAYELKNMAHGMPEHISAATSFGLTGEQASTDIPALLQILRQASGSSGNANTMLRQGIKHLTDPSDVKRIKNDLDIDVFDVRRQAVADGKNPLMAVANAIADKLTGIDAGKVDYKSESIVGGDPEKLGGIAREYNFRAFINAFTQLRGSLDDYATSGPEAAKQVTEDFNSRAGTAAGALDRLAISADQAAIKAGGTQLDAVKKMADRKADAIDWVAKQAEKAPNATSAALSTWSIGSQAIKWFGAIGGSIATAALGWQGLKAVGVKHPGAAGVAKAAIKAPWDVAKGFGEGVSAGAAEAATEFPRAATIGRGLIGSLKNGLIAGSIYEVGKWGIDKGFEKAAGPIHPEAERFSNLSTIGKLGDLLSRLAETIVPSAHAETMASPSQSGAPAQPKVDMSEADAAQNKASTMAEAIKTTLEVTAKPTIDTSSIDAAQAKVIALGASIRGLGSSMAGVARSVSRGAGALHDGFETQ